MTAGMPGTGIGGLFYVLLAIWMPFHELFALARGRSSWKRWRFIGGQWAILASCLVSLWYFTEFLRWGYEKAAKALAGGGGTFQPPVQTSTMAFTAAWAGAITLTTVLMSVFVLRAIMRRRKSQVAIRAESRPIADLQPTRATSALRESVGLEAVK